MKSGFLERGVIRYLEHIHAGHIVLRRPDGSTMAFGDEKASRKVELTLHETEFLRRLAVNPSLALGEAYLDGHWDVSSGRLADVFGILWENRSSRPGSRSLAGR